MATREKIIFPIFVAVTVLWSNYNGRQAYEPGGEGANPSGTAT